MERRPNIERGAIKNELLATPVQSGSREYSTHCYNTEVVGTDGRNHWFRWECRECERKFISSRNENRQRKFRCPDCESCYFINKGFFNAPDRPGGTEVVPLKAEEVDGELYRIKLDYAKSDFDQFTWFYGTEEYLNEKVESEYWEVVEPMEKV